jgi:hypothetical protein
MNVLTLVTLLSRETICALIDVTLPESALRLFDTTLIADAACALTALSSVEVTLPPAAADIRLLNALTTL